VFYLELSCLDIATCLAVDEAFLVGLETHGSGEELLYVWEPPDFAVVVGSGTRLDHEVKLNFCQALKIPIFRRISGGSSVVIGPGCLIYSLFLNRAHRPGLASPSEAHRFVLTQVAKALQSCVPEVEFYPPSDLGYCGRKFSGNSIRIKGKYLLYHGTILYRFPLEIVSLLLKEPPRQPEWRRKRCHKDFIINIPLSKGQLISLLRHAWQAYTTWIKVDWAQISDLVRARYSNALWNQRL
jgi:lipoate-protein ligase A